MDSDNNRAGNHPPPPDANSNNPSPTNTNGTPIQPFFIPTSITFTLHPMPVPPQAPAQAAQAAPTPAAPAHPAHPVFGPPPPPQPAQEQTPPPPGQPQSEGQQPGANPFYFTFFLNPPGAPPVSPTTAPADGTPPAQAQQQQPPAGGWFPFYVPLGPQFFFAGFPFGAPPPPPERQPDYARASLLLRALEEVDPELLARWERVSPADEDREDGAKCAVCLERLRDLPPLDTSDNNSEPQKPAPPLCPLPSTSSVALPCHHAFHSPCIFPWLASSTSCPVCRFDLDPSSLTLTLSPSPPPQQPMGPRDRARPYPSQEARKQRERWVLPLGPRGGETMREWVGRREREEGWTCDDPACVHVVPLALDQPGEKESKRPLVHLSPSLASSTTNEELPAGACPHKFHPECLVGSIRSRANAVVERAPGGVWVECGLCRGGKGGWVKGEEWEDGERVWEAV